ncbi:O-antigen ligase family protein [Glutamicibacter arilaitensis]|uniref:O-antigen ligase family protein n=1 Tax=Glutamicibacter arilaitensis TaxID=256701 RepID=UPI003FD6097B
MQLALLILFFVVFIAVTGKQSHLQVLLPVFMWTFIPWVASDLVTGIDLGGNGLIPSMHPATWYVLVLFLVRCASPRRRFGIVLYNHQLFTVVVTGYCLLAATTTFIFAGVKGIPSIIYLILCPAIMALLILEERALNDNFSSRLRNSYLLICVIQSCLAIIQYLTHKVLFYEDSYSKQYWWSSDLTRALGTTDHSLMLGLLLTGGIALSFGLRKKSLPVLLSVLFMAGILTTGSRTSLVVSVVIVIWYIFASKISVWIKLFLFAGTVAFSWFVLEGTLFSTSLERFDDDSGSLRVRFLAYDLFERVWTDYLLLGGGATHSYEVLANERLTTSFESTFLTFSIDYGVLATTLFYIGMIGFAIVGIRKKLAVQGAVIAFFGAFIIFHSYSGGSVQSSAASILWILVALASMRANDQKAPDSLPEESIGHSTSQFKV